MESGSGQARCRTLLSARLQNQQEQQNQEHRSQEMNRAEALQRLHALIESVATPPLLRKATKPTYGSKLRRLETKSQRAAVKAGRAKAEF